ncbi:MAG: DUF2231 domain-containing protein [Dermatophilaceae bacterium]
MFDTILGLPQHPLVVHAVVVLLPLMAVATAVVALRRPWRERFAWPVVVADLLVLGASFAAKESGEALQRRLGVRVDDHVRWGDSVPLAALGLVVAALLVALGRRRPGLSGVATVLAVVAGAATVFWVLQAGHTGASAVWGGVVR